MSAERTTRPSADFLASNDEVHVHRLKLDNVRDDFFRRALALLSEEEQTRAARIRHESARRRFVIVRSALRTLLGQYIGCAPSSIEFTLGEKGKPRLAGTEPDRGLVFNVSHSGAWGLIAVASETALGVDVERHRDMSNADGIAERCFGPCELAYWRALPQERRQPAFFSLWSCKESFVKATGEGITLGLEACVVAPSTPPRLVSVPEGYGKPQEWRLVELETGGGYSAALCYRGKERRLRLFRE